MPTNEPNLSPDVAAKLLKGDLANIIKKVRDGKSLSRAERGVLLAAQSGSSESAPVASNYTELAGMLGVSRRSISNWRTRPGVPHPAANGELDVNAWREWMRANDIRATEIEDDEEGGEDREKLKDRKLLAEVQEREFRLAIRKREYVPIEAVKERWAFHSGQAITLLKTMLEDEAPPILVGLSAVEIRQEMGRVIDSFIDIIHSGGGDERTY